MLHPKLKPFSVLVGEWHTTGTHPALPGVILHGHVSFEWMVLCTRFTIAEGAFLLMHSAVEEEGIPRGMAVFGSDDSSDVATMLYFDERGVSRIYQTTLSGNIWKLWRNVPGFSQRATGTFADENNTIQVIWELSKDNSHWASDLEQTYTRVK